MADPLPTSKKIFDLEGEGQVNADGRSRQQELRRCLPGEPVVLRRERGNQADSDVITILSARGVPIGRLTRQYAALLGPLLGQGRPHRAKLHCLRGGLGGYPNYGARISIAWDGRRELRHRPLDQEQERYRQPREQAGTAPASARATPPAWAGATIFRGGDPDAAQLALVCVILVLGVIAAYEIANAISSACWACG